MSAGIWALVRHEQIDFLPTAHLKTIFMDKENQPLWEHIQAKVNVSLFVLLPMILIFNFILTNVISFRR